MTLLSCPVVVAAAAVAELLRMKGIPNIMFWSEDPSALVSAHFSSIFFSVLGMEPHVTLLEAYALSLFATQVRKGAWGTGWRAAEWHLRSAIGAAASSSPHLPSSTRTNTNNIVASATHACRSHSQHAPTAPLCQPHPTTTTHPQTPTGAPRCQG